jgi:hypothetical protein
LYSCGCPVWHQHKPQVAIDGQLVEHQLVQHVSLLADFPPQHEVALALFNLAGDALRQLKVLLEGEGVVRLLAADLLLALLGGLPNCLLVAEH